MVASRKEKRLLVFSRRSPDQLGGLRLLLWPTLATLAALAVLLSLGTWQLARRTWKEQLIETIKARIGADPIALAVAMSHTRRGEDLEYTPVRVHGRFIPDKAMFYYAPDAKLGPGYHVYMPLETSGGELVIINRGYVPEREALAVRSRIAGPPDQPGEVVGLLRSPGAKGLFTPDNDFVHNLWYWRDINGMASHVRRDGHTTVMPFFIDALSGSGPAAFGVGRGGATRLELPNRHLEYAVTWYGLAGALIIVYLFFVHGLLANRQKLQGRQGETDRRSWGNS